MKKIIHPDGYAFQLTKVIQQRGKFNAVYLAIDEKNDRFVIVKKLNEPVSAQAIAQFKKGTHLANIASKHGSSPGLFCYPK
jgi:serine/threonine protein kinase